MSGSTLTMYLGDAFRMHSFLFCHLCEESGDGMSHVFLLTKHKAQGGLPIDFLRGLMISLRSNLHSLLL
jgi:hypothetical protein